MPKAKAKGAQKTQAQEATPTSQQQRPNWPVLKPLAPASDLLLETVTPSQILVARNLLTSTLCRSYVAFLSALPLATTPGKPKKGDAVRVSDRFQIDDTVFAERLWRETALKDLVLGHEDPALWGGDVLGLNPNIRIYRYSKGQFFDKHYDDSNNVTFPSTPPIPAKTTWTLLIYLTSPATGCVGGETVFYPDPPSKKAAAPEPVVAELEVGMALLHKHGRDCMLHEGREVLEGEKWIIRSDLCVRR